MTTQQNRSFTDSILPSAPLDEAIDWIANNLSPGDVFSETDLKVWAESNGYIEESI